MKKLSILLCLSIPVMGYAMEGEGGVAGAADAAMVDSDDGALVPVAVHPSVSQPGPPLPPAPAPKVSLNYGPPLPPPAPASIHTCPPPFQPALNVTQQPYYGPPLHSPAPAPTNETPDGSLPSQWEEWMQQRLAERFDIIRQSAQSYIAQVSTQLADINGKLIGENYEDLIEDGSDEAIERVFMSKKTQLRHEIEALLDNLDYTCISGWSEIPDSVKPMLKNAVKQKTIRELDDGSSLQALKLLGGIMRKAIAVHKAKQAPSTPSKGVKGDE